MPKKAEPILVDSNILIYAINSASPKHQAAQNFLEQNVKRLAVAQQNILESLRVLTHKKFTSPMTSENAIEAVTSITDACHLITPNKISHHLALMLVAKHQLDGDEVFDAYLAATALSNDVPSIATDNVKDFELFEELEVIQPFE